MDQVQRILKYIEDLIGPIPAEELTKVTLDTEILIETGCSYIKNNKFPLTCEKAAARQLSYFYKISKQTGVEGVQSISQGDTKINFGKNIDFDMALSGIKTCLNPWRKPGQLGLRSDDPITA